MDEILADYNEAELGLLAGFLQKVTAAGVIAAAPTPPHCRGRVLADARPRFVSYRRFMFHARTSGTDHLHPLGSA
jgi:hypothetical protein